MKKIILTTLVYISCFFAIFLFWGITINNEFLNNPNVSKNAVTAWGGVALIMVPALCFYFFVRKLMIKEKYKLAFITCFIFGLSGFLMPTVQRIIF